MFKIVGQPSRSETWPDTFWQHLELPNGDSVMVRGNDQGIVTALNYGRLDHVLMWSAETE